MNKHIDINIELTIWCKPWTNILLYNNIIVIIYFKDFNNLIIL